MPQVQDIFQSATAVAQSLGVKKFDIYGSLIDDTSVEVFQGEPKQVEASNRANVIVRVWNDNQQVGVTSTTDVDPLGVELALKTAYEASFFGVKENIPDFSPAATAPVATVPSHPADPVAISTLIDKLIDAEKNLVAAHPAIASVPYNGLSQQDVERFYLNSSGALRQESRAYASVYLYTKTEQEGKKPRSAGAYRVNTNLQQLDISGCIQEAATKTISHLDYHPIPSGKYLVVFSPRAFLSLLAAFSNLFNAQNILDKQSLSTPETLGKAIAAPYLNLADDALHPANVSAETFDGEGTPTRRVDLIKEGVLTSFLHSSLTAQRLNAQLTGHGNIGAKVSVSPHFYHVSAAQPPAPTTSLETAENVVYIDSLQALHAGVNSLQGSFSLPFDGWLINKGEKTSIDSATVAGDFLTLLQTIVCVEAEEELTPSGVSPRVWVADLAITGEQS
jgi:PmbA protein